MCLFLARECVFESAFILLNIVVSLERSRAGLKNIGKQIGNDDGQRMVKGGHA